MEGNYKFDINTFGKSEIPFSCPEDYFERLSSQIESKTVNSSFQTTKITAPFETPKGYFEKLALIISLKISQTFEYLPKENLLPEFASPTEEYFFQLQQNILNQTTRKSKPVLNRDSFVFPNIPQIAVAICSILLILCTVFVYQKVDNQQNKNLGNTLSKKEIAVFLAENADEIDINNEVSNLNLEGLNFIQLEGMSESEKEKLFLENISSY